jgi:hypothetical protein
MIKNSVQLLAFVFLFGTSLQLHAQLGMGKIEEIEAVQARKLIVMIEEPREKMLKKIAKKPKRGSVEDYKADLITYNENVKAVVEKFWPYNKSNIQYKTFDEIEALRKTKTEDYAVLACLSTEASSFSAGYNYSEGLHWVKDIKDDFEDRSDGMFSVLLVNTIEDFGKKPVYFTPLFDVFPTKASLVYGIKTAQNYFDLRVQTKKNGVKMRDENQRLEEDMLKRAPMLAEKTLLIRQEWLDKELTEANLKSFYPYKYMICDREFMDNVAMNLDGNYAYGVVLPYVISGSHKNSVLYFQFVMDGADSQALCVVRPSTGSMMLAGGLTGKAGNRNFTIKVMEKVVEQVQGKGK